MGSLKKLVKWFEDREGKVTYSMNQRSGPNSYDCSSAVYSALWYAGYTTKINWLGNTETLFKENGYLFKEVKRSEVRRGDIFIAGVEGNSLGAGGHTGMVYNYNQIIHCNYSSNGIAVTPLDGYTGSPVRFFRITQSNTDDTTINVDNYDDNELAQMVIDGELGVGDERKEILGDRYDSVQAKVNEQLAGYKSPVVLEYNGAVLRQDVLDLILAECDKHNILASYAITVLHYEGLWGNSEVARLNNNWGGMTWIGEEVRPSGVHVEQGTPRPTAETGYYMAYDSVRDFLCDWFYLLRAGGSYKVAGATTFDKAVKGMFKAGGAVHDYATIGYTKYLKGAKARLQAIEQVNGSLSRFDKQTSGEWQKNDTGWWYKDTDGTYPALRWKEINGVWYRFNADGYMLENSWYRGKGDKWFYLKSGGAMARNEILIIHDKSYYFDNDGVLRTETTIY